MNNEEVDIEPISCFRPCNKFGQPLNHVATVQKWDTLTGAEKNFYYEHSFSGKYNPSIRYERNGPRQRMYNGFLVFARTQLLHKYATCPVQDIVFKNEWSQMPVEEKEEWELFAHRLNESSEFKAQWNNSLRALASRSQTTPSDLPDSIKLSALEMAARPNGPMYQLAKASFVKAAAQPNGDSCTNLHINNDLSTHNHFNSFSR